MRFFFTDELKKKIASLTPERQKQYRQVGDNFTGQPFFELMAYLKGDEWPAPHYRIRYENGWQIVYAKSKTKDGSRIVVLMDIIEPGGNAAQYAGGND